ncbi:M56 family metallopeptidase [Pedobacter foliorum]|uniref:M56 family metallopeptidase n=1 Tax=Pedobacter foliorum TaxID=2739058 RepID=UPI001567BA97|nr:M56 family metallopeptidase [Pedobacter foliorum]NRF38777.1 M56 family metallopeptidase [Pedobacter foliorum]
MEWLVYLLKVSACMALFYAFYHLCLQRLTFFSTNRTYLLTTLIISFVIPAMQLQVQRSAIDPAQLKQDVTVHTNNFTDLRNPALANPSPLPQTIEGRMPINWQEVLFACYWIIAVIMFGVFIFQALQLLKYTRKVNLKVGRLKVVFKPDGFTNCSFLNYVFVDQEELTEEEMKVILQHEQVHVARYHSVDKLLLSTCKALLWFNPLIYLYDSALEQVHEYEADRETSLTIGDTPYANLLLAMAVKKNNPSLAHSFVRNPLKGRIKMLFTNQSKNMKKLTYLAVLPVGLVLTWAFAVQVVYARLPDETIKQRPVTPSHNESVSLQPTMTQEALKTEKPDVMEASSDTLWMIDDPSANKYSEVIIDGKSYDKDILTKISPACISGTTSIGSKIKITTHHNEIEYATKIDKENAIIRNKAFASGKVYIRYPQKRQDGSRYDKISIMLKNGAGGSVSLDRGEKLLLVFNGKQYSEQEFKSLGAGQFKGYNISFRSGLDKDEEIKAKYGKGYGSMIEIYRVKEVPPSDTISYRFQSDGQQKVFRRPMGLDVDDGYGKFSYSAQDSVIYVKGFADVLLYGDVKMSNDRISIKADKIKFNGTEHIALAKNVSFTEKGKAEVKDVPFVRFNLRAGTYKVLKEIKEF